MRLRPRTRDRCDDRYDAKSWVIKISPLVKAHAPALVEGKRRTGRGSKARRRIGRRIGKRHAQMQKLTALQHHSA